jgi:23S rRNA (adenine-N6)-dimethyltransferase
MAPRSLSSLWRTQNFLRQPSVVDLLLDRSGIGPDDDVYDIGAGAGILTDRLAERCRRVFAVEKDPRLCAVLHARFAGRANVEVRCADALDLALPRRPYKVFASLPFDATAAILSRLLSAPVPPDDAFLVVQKEAAERFSGAPVETLVALLLKPWFAPTIEHHFRRADFAPAPGVDVVLLRLRKRGPPLLVDADGQLYRDFVSACFTAWQPTVGAALGRVLGRRPAAGVVAIAGVDAGARPTATSFPAWLRLFRAFLTAGGPAARQAVAGAEARLRRQQAGLRKRHRTRPSDRPPRRRDAASVRPGETSETRGPPVSTALRLAGRTALRTRPLVAWPNCARIAGDDQASRAAPRRHDRRRRALLVRSGPPPASRRARRPVPRVARLPRRARPPRHGRPGRDRHVRAPPRDPRRGGRGLDDESAPGRGSGDGNVTLCLTSVRS